VTIDRLWLIVVLVMCYRNVVLTVGSVVWSVGTFRI